MTVDQLIERVEERLEAVKAEHPDPIAYVRALGVEAEKDEELYGLGQPGVITGILVAEVLHDHAPADPLP